MKRISLTYSKYALIDDEDFERVDQYKWRAYLSKNTFRARSSTGLSLSNLIMNCPDNKEVDHINLDSLDCQKHNLRICSCSENNRNRKSLIGSVSKYKGVTWRKNRGKWQACIWIENIFGQQTSLYLGCNFNNEEEAALAYDNAARQEHGKFGRYNFPLEGEQSAL